LRHLNLQPALTRPGAHGEDVEDQRGAIKHLALENVFQTAALSGGQFFVEDDSVHLVLPAPGGKFLRLALAQKGAGIGNFHFLGAFADDGGPGGFRQFGQFIQRFTRGAVRA